MNIFVIAALGAMIACGVSGIDKGVKKVDRVTVKVTKKTVHHVCHYLTDGKKCK